MGIVDICRVALFSITAILFAVNGVYNLYFGRKAFQEVTYCCGKRKYLSPEDTLNHTVRILVISCVISTAFALLALRLIEVNKVEAQLMLNYCLTVFVCLAFDISLLMVSAIPLAFGKLEPVRKVLPIYTKVIWAGKAKSSRATEHLFCVHLCGRAETSKRAYGCVGDLLSVENEAAFGA